MEDAEYVIENFAEIVKGDGYLIGETVTIFIAFVNSLSIFRTSWQAEYYRKDWLTAHYSIRGVPTPLLTFSGRYPFSDSGDTRSL